MARSYLQRVRSVGLGAALPLALLLAGCGGGSDSSSTGGGTPIPAPSPTPSVTPTPTVTLTVSPATIMPGASATLSWTSSAGASGCTASGDASFSGAQPATGSVTVSPAATTNYVLSCTFSSGGVAGSATLTVQGPRPPVGAAGAFANPDDGGIPDRGLHPLAFPTAIGFGRGTSVRAANAVVYKINTLDDVADTNDGKISYRECALALAVTTPYSIPAGRPRYCVFDVAGAIILQSPARITIPKIYIAGQTSPGGIEFRLGANYNPVDSLIDTRRGGDHMILRHVRVRLGEHPGRSSDNGDPIRLQETSFQIIDHVSSMFGTDESLDTACQNCTIQWSIIGPNICLNAGHSSSLHCKSFFLKPASNVTIAHNLTQHGEQRGINIAVGSNPATAGNVGQADIFNNVLYDFIAETGLISNQFGSVYANYIANLNLRGPRYNASDGNYLIGLYTPGGLSFGFDIYARDNVTPRTRIAGQFGSTVTDPFLNAAGFITHVLPSTICGVTPAGVADCSRSGLSVVQNSAYALAPGRSLMFDPGDITTAEQALRDVMAYGGADLCRDGPCRDNVDALYIDDLRTCDTAPWLFESSWASTVAQSGGWANLTQGTAKPDSDNDGMPDDWERRFRNTNPDVWDANADADGDGYPNVEEYLNALAQDDVRYAGFVGSGTGRVPAYNCGRPMY